MILKPRIGGAKAPSERFSKLVEQEVHKADYGHVPGGAVGRCFTSHDRHRAEVKVILGLLDELWATTQPVRK